MKKLIGVMRARRRILLSTAAPLALIAGLALTLKSSAYAAPERLVMTIAALWSEWKDTSTSDGLKSCAMVVTEPNQLVAEAHDRMPVVLETEDFDQWEQGDVKDAAALMKPAGEGVLQTWPVSKRVNSSRADDDDATLIESIG